MSSQPYVLHSAEGRPVAAPLGGNDTGEFDSFITHPWRKYCTTRWEFLPRFIPLFTFAFTILVMVLVIDGKLKVHAGVYQRTAVNGYSALEQAGSTERVRNILRAWSPTQRLMAAFSSGLHFLFTFLYVAVITMACCWGVRFSQSPDHEHISLTFYRLIIAHTKQLATPSPGFSFLAASSTSSSRSVSICDSHPTYHSLTLLSRAALTWRFTVPPPVSPSSLWLA